MAIMNDGVEELLGPLATYRPRSLWDGALRNAAVLIPFLADTNQLVFTLRSQQLKHHAGAVQGN